MKFGWLTLAHSPSPERRRARHLRAARAGDARRGAGLRRRLAHRAQLHGRERLRGPDPVRRRARHAHAAHPHRLRRHPDGAAPSGAARDPAVACSTISRSGRLDVGVGRGTIFNEYEFVGYGLRSDDARERMAEALDVMTRAWTATPLDHKGKYFTLSLPELRPAPVQRPHPPIWHSVASAASFRVCGEKGVPILTVRLPIAQIGRAPWPVRRGPQRKRTRRRGAEAAVAAGRDLALGLCGREPRRRRGRARRRPRPDAPPHEPCAPRPEPARLPGRPGHAQPLDRPEPFRGGGHPLRATLRHADRHARATLPSRLPSCATPASAISSAR